MKNFNGKTLLITGGTGSFGNTVLTSYLKSDVKEVIIFSRDEKKQEDMRLLYNDNKIKFVLGDVRSKDSLVGAMSGVDYVFHAAALKQVPSAEFNAFEAVQTNILGTQNVIDAAVMSNVSSLVVLSTDKAVYPINAMGISKAMGERLVYSASIKHASTVLSCTRYGNVMASRGSVIPLFIDRIMNDEEVTVTDMEMTRFLMSLDESVDLVRYAFSNSKNGDLFVRKSPAATVEVLLYAIEKICNKKAKIKLIGSRHGEKKHETLISREELLRAEDLGDYYRIPADNRDLNYGEYISEGSVKLNSVDDYTSATTQRLNVDSTVKLLLENTQVNKYLKHYS
jgi:UDP-N-acetylglucosamine 4,6-dehydratase/5-epimerase